MKVGLFFGSFNPVHNGHLILAEQIYRHCAFDHVRFVISPQNPFKKNNSLLDTGLRIELLKEALSNCEYLSVESVELTMPIPSFTIDTMDVLTSKEPNVDFYIIMGSDNLENLHRWKDSKRLIASNQFIIYPRMGFKNETYIDQPNFAFPKVPIIELSSTDIRNAIVKKEPYRYMVHHLVYRKIKENQLYLDL